MRLVLYDLDGTLTKRDTLWSFLRYYAGNMRFVLWVIVAGPWLLFYAFGLINAEKAKQKLLSIFLKGHRRTEIETAGEEFCKLVLPGILNEKQMEFFRKHQSAGDKICIVTASCSAWVAPFCTAQNVDIIATELEFANGIFNGNFKTPNCKGQEKVRRIKLRYKLEDYEQVVAYGNKGPDDAMLNLAQLKNVV